MKNRILPTLLFISIAFLLASCTQYTREDFPYGKWHSTDPDLTIDIGLEYNDTLSYFGTYVKDGESIDVLVYADLDGTLEVHNFEEYDFNEDHWDYRDKYGNIKNPPPKYFNGDWRPVSIFDGKLRYKLDKDYREATGYNVLVFEKIESHEGSTSIFSYGDKYKLNRIPYGRWQSEEPCISLDLDPNGEFKGSYGAETPIEVTVDFFWFGPGEGMCIESEENSGSDSKIFFEGRFREEGDKLIYDLTDGSLSPIGKSIVFEKVGDYEIPPPVPTEYEHPGEVWRSDDPAITINFDPESNGRHYFGSFEKDGERIGTVSIFEQREDDGIKVLKIFDKKDYMFYNGEWKIAGCMPIFLGTYETDGDEMRLAQIPPWRKMTGYSEIVFKKSTIADDEAEN